MDNMQNNNYGAPNFQPPVQVNDGKGMSIAALILGISGIVGSLLPVVCFFTTVCAVLALIFGIKGRKASTEAYGKASGMATVGLVFGIIGVAFAALGLICYTICLGAACAVANEASNYSYYY